MRAGHLPAQPLADWLRATTSRRWPSVNAAATALGLDEARLRALMRPSPETGVTLRLVDELFIAADEPHMLPILYPLDER